MKKSKIITYLSLAATLVLAGAGLSATAVHAEEKTDAAQVTSTQTDLSPTFDLTTHESMDTETSLSLRFGNNLLLAGNNISTDAKTTGLLLAAGNSLELHSQADYSFIAGNSISYAGATTKDLFIAGNLVTLTENAELKGDVFAAGNEIKIQTELNGDFAGTAAKITFASEQTLDNLNLSAEKVVFEKPVKVLGAFTYNDDAEIIGLSNVEAERTESYHIDIDQPTLAETIYAKFLSICSLFVAMVIICAIFRRVREKVTSVNDTSSITTSFAYGALALFIIPIVAFFAICTIVGAPIALVALALYVCAIYLSQGFAGLWLGSYLVEHCFKLKTNVYLELLIGITILGVLSLIPYIGELTGVLGLLLGLGLIIRGILAKTGQSQSGATDSSEPSKSSKTVIGSGKTRKGA